jgi:hypothetical protein
MEQRDKSDADFKADFMAFLTWTPDDEQAATKSKAEEEERNKSDADFMAYLTWTPHDAEEATKSKEEVSVPSLGDVVPVTPERPSASSSAIAIPWTPERPSASPAIAHSSSSSSSSSKRPLPLPSAILPTSKYRIKK